MHEFKLLYQYIGVVLNEINLSDLQEVKDTMDKEALYKILIESNAVEMVSLVVPLFLSVPDCFQSSQFSPPVYFEEHYYSLCVQRLSNKFFDNEFPKVCVLLE